MVCGFSLHCIVRYLQFELRGSLAQFFFQYNQFVLKLADAQDFVAGALVLGLSSIEAQNRGLAFGLEYRKSQPNRSYCFQEMREQTNSIYFSLYTCIFVYIATSADGLQRLIISCRCNMANDKCTQERSAIKLHTSIRSHKRQLDKHVTVPIYYVYFY